MAVLFWVPDLVLFLGPFSFSCRGFIIKRHAQGKIQRGQYWYSQKEWYVPQKQHLLRGSYIICLLISAWLAMGLPLLHSSIWVFRFPFSIFVKPTFKPVFSFAYIKKKASVCASKCAESILRACLKVFCFVFLYWNRLSSNFLQMAQVLISVTSRQSKTCCSVFFFIHHTNFK